MIGRIQSYSPNFKGNFTIGKNDSGKIAKTIDEIYYDDEMKQEVIRELVDLKEFWNKNTPKNDHGYIDLNSSYGYTRELDIQVFHQRKDSVLCHEAKSIAAYDMEHVKRRIDEDLKNENCIARMDNKIKEAEEKHKRIDRYTAILNGDNNPTSKKIKKVSCHIVQD